MPKVSIMITSCDAYRDCWKPMIYSLDKYWPDCEWPRYIITNYAEENLPNTKIIKVGDDHRSWCNLARMGMSQIDADYILFFQEDYWLCSKIDNKAMKAHVDYMDKHGVDYLKVDRDMPRDKFRIGNTDYCDNPPNIRYSVNTAMAFWRKEAMKQLMIENWSGWEYERQIIPYVQEHGIKINSQRLFSPLVSSKGIVTIRENAVVRGVWTQAAVSFLKDNNMEDVIEKREVMGPITTWLYSHSPSPQSVLRYPFWGALKLLKQMKVNW